MSIDLKQFAGSAVKPADDARLYSFMLNNKTGIVEGVEITHLGANQLKVSAGWGICCGRMFEVEEEIVNTAVSASGEIKGRLIINIDTSADVPASFVTQAAAALPKLIQEDINGSGIVYQIPLAEYTVNELQCSNLIDTRIMLEIMEVSVNRAQTAADNALQKAENAQDAAETAQNAADNALQKAGNAQNAAVSAQATADNAMPLGGGTFTGNAIAYSTNRKTACLRNITVCDSTGSTSMSTNRILMYRK